MWKRTYFAGLLSLTALNGAWAQQPVRPSPTPAINQLPKSTPVQPVPQAPTVQPAPQAPMANNAAPQTAQRGMDPTAFQRAEFVKVDPLSSTLILRRPDGNLVRDLQLPLHSEARFFGKDRLPIPDAVRFNGFRPGETVWYRMENGARGQLVSDVLFYDPSQPARPVAAPERQIIAAPAISDVRGTIVRIDPSQRMMMLRTPEGETEFRIADDARVWDANRVLIAEGLTYRGLRTNATVWLRVDPSNPKIGNEIRLFDPTQTQADIRAEILNTNLDMHVFVARTTQGEVEYRVTSATRYWDVKRNPLEDGLSYPLFRAGATVWLRVGISGSIMSVTEMRFYNPSTPEPRKIAATTNEIRGQIVRVFPEEKRLVLRTGEGRYETDGEFLVTSSTRYWDEKKVPFMEGLGDPLFRSGAVIWFKLGIVDNVEAITEIRFTHPGQIGERTDQDEVGAIGYRSFPPGTYTWIRPMPVWPRGAKPDVFVPVPSVDLPVRP